MARSPWSQIQGRASSRLRPQNFVPRPVLEDPIPGKHLWKTWEMVRKPKRLLSKCRKYLEETWERRKKFLCTFKMVTGVVLVRLSNFVCIWCETVINHYLTLQNVALQVLKLSCLKIVSRSFVTSNLTTLEEKGAYSSWWENRLRPTKRHLT